MEDRCASSDLTGTSPTRKPSRRRAGWRLVKSAYAAQIDGVVALAMGAERTSQATYGAKLLGFA